jgi:drug/metabolite transporter (DMT)-like permease
MRERKELVPEGFLVLATLIYGGTFVLIKGSLADCSPLIHGLVLGLMVVFLGMCLYSAPETGGVNIGDMITFGGAVGYAFYIVLLDRFARRDDPVALTVRLLWALACLSILGSVAAVCIMNRFQKDTTPTRAVIIYSLEPVFTLLLSLVLLGEELTGRNLLGSVCILCGVFFSELSGIARGVQEGNKEKVS